MSRWRPAQPRAGPAFRRRRSLARKILDWLLAAAILGLLILLSAQFDRFDTRTASGTAVVNDGDSLTIGAERIRLRGIDAPEYAQICERNGVDYACGRMSRGALAQIVAGRRVICEGWERDRYGRILGGCSAGGVSLNRSQIEAGWAVSYGDYSAEEQVARQRRVGLWAGTFDNPRQWRDAHGGMAEGAHDHIGSALNWLREMFRFSRPEAL